jgi:hypothetical protein
MKELNMPEEQDKQKHALRAVLGAVKISENALSSTIADPKTDPSSRAALKAVKKHFDFLFATAELANKVIEDQASKSISREQEIVSEQGKDYILPLDSDEGWVEFVDNLARKKALRDTVIPSTGDHIGKKPDSQTAGTKTGRISCGSPNFVNAPETKPSDRIEASLDYCLEVMRGTFDKDNQRDLHLVEELTNKLIVACSQNIPMSGKLKTVTFQVPQKLIDAFFRVGTHFFKKKNVDYSWSSEGVKEGKDPSITFDFSKLYEERKNKLQGLKKEA